MKKLYSVNYTKKHDIHPFEDITGIEAYCKKLECGLFSFINSNKKRPNNLVIGNIFEN